MATISFLLSAEAATARMLERKPMFVVHAETRKSGMVELDADSLDHGHVLAAHWCEHMGAMSASVRRVSPDGTLSKVVGTIHSDMDHENYVI